MSGSSISGSEMPSQIRRWPDKTLVRVAFISLAGLLVLTLAMLARHQRHNAQPEMPAREEQSDDLPGPISSGDVEINVSSHQYAREHERMIRQDLEGRGISDRRVLAAMARVPRHRFVPEELRHSAYTDRPLPIGHRQTISQPYIVAWMTQLAKPDAQERALDIGTGSGYQAAVLAELVKEVYSIEILCPLADDARDRLQSLGYDKVDVRCGDGYRGWPEHAPFDVIILAAAPDHVPQPLIDQLAAGGRLVMPVGGFWQELIVIEKDADGGTSRRRVAGVRFVPMTGEAQEK